MRSSAHALSASDTKSGSRLFDISAEETTAGRKAALDFVDKSALPNGYMYNLGPVIDARRAALRLSIKELARRAGVSRQTLRTWRGSTTHPRQEHLSALAAALEMSPRDLLVQALPAPSEPGAAA